MDDQAMLQTIEALVEEEHKLYARGGAGHPLTDDEQARLRALEVQLDQL